MDLSLPASPIPGTNTLLVGPTGTGKTHCIRTLVEAGLEVFVLFTEPFMDVLSDLPEDRLHWHYVPPAAPTWDNMIDSARKINSLTFENLSKLKDINKQSYDQFLQVLNQLSNFECQRTGLRYGPVDSWGTGRAIVVDSLSGLNIMAMDLVVGSKPVKAIADWGVSMDNLERLISKLCNDTRAWFVLTAHLDRELDEFTGATQMMAATLGRKLAPRLPRFFHDVILCRREGAVFTWSTAAIGVDLKAKNLPIADNIQPSFGQIVDVWKRKGGTLEQEKQP